MNPAKRYCREISRHFDSIAVYLPGSLIEVGDILSFKKEAFYTRTLGPFVRESSLSNLGIAFKSRLGSTNSNLTYSSKGGVELVAEAKTPNLIEGTIRFIARNSIYFNAISCSEKSIEDFLNIKRQVHHSCGPHFDNLFIVTKVITAKKAVIMQGSDQNGELRLQTHLDPKLGTSVDLQVIAHKKQEFIINSSSEVTVLMDLYKIRITKNKRSAGTESESKKSIVSVYKSGATSFY